MSQPLTTDELVTEHRARYDTLNAAYHAKRDALDVDYDQAIDQHGADPVLLVAYMDAFGALDAEFYAKRDAMDAEYWVEVEPARVLRLAAMPEYGPPKITVREPGSWSFTLPADYVSPIPDKRDAQAGQNAEKPPAGEGGREGEG